MNNLMIDDRILEEGDRCPECKGRCPECKGTMGYEPVENCYCHINPPCSNCTDNPLVCLECGYGMND